MSIWKDLYDIYDNVNTNFLKTNASKQTVSFEIQCNLKFIADALQNQFSPAEVVKGLDCSAFDDALKRGFDFNTIAKDKLKDQTIGTFDEFTKYVGKDTDYLVKNAYLKISSLTKLVKGADDKDYSLKIKSLFRFFMLLVAHIEGQPLIKVSS